MKFCVLSSERIIRWVTIAYIGTSPVLFRYGNIIAVAQSALLIAAPTATAGLALSHAKVPASYLRRYSMMFCSGSLLKSLLLAQVVNLCLSLLLCLCHWRDC